MLTLKDYPTFRQWIQVVAAAVLGALVSYKLIDSNAAAAVIAFIAAVLPNALAVFNTPSTLRAWLFGVVGAVQVILISLDVFTEAQITPIVNIVLAVLSVSVAVTHTETPLAQVIPLRADVSGGLGGASSAA